MQAPRKVLKGCESSFLAIKRKSLGKVEYRVFPLTCHSWDCPVCARAKAKMYRERMRPLFDGRKLWMYTFTYYHSKSPIEVWRDYSTAWNRFRTAATKRYGHFSYARILEHHHKSAYPHLHIIADKEFKPVWLAAELTSAGFGYQAKCKPITTEGAVIYVTKYLSKPWTDEACKAIRKNLRLRIISFGGGACDRSRSGHSWSVITRDIESDLCSCKCNIDRDWTYGTDVKLLNTRVVDAFVEEIYSITGELTFIEGSGDG